MSGGKTAVKCNRMPRPPQNLFVQMVILTATASVAAAIILPIGWTVSHQWNGIMAGAAAGGTCLVAAAIALFVSHFLRDPRHWVASLLVGMAIRMAVPLTAAILVKFSGWPLADAGFLNYLIVFYPVTLAAETYLSWPQGDKNRSSDSSAGGFVG